MKRIAYIVPSLANRGPVIVVKELVAQMVCHGQECTVFYFDDKIELEFDCPTIRIQKKEQIDFTSYDIVHSHGMRPDRYVARFREYSGKVRYISTVHNYVLEDFRYQYNWLVAQIFGRLWMRTLRNMDVVVALSRHAQEYYQKWLPVEKITYAYNTRVLNLSQTLDEKSAQEIRSFKGHSILIGVNALLTKRKGVDILIRALVRLPDYKLFIAGDGKERARLERLARRLGVADRCLFAGYRQNAYLYLPLYDIYALPSRSEGFPLSLLEAAVYAKPCVVSNLPIVTECFNTDEVAIFRLDAPTSVIQAIHRATANSTLGRNLHLKYEKAYSPEKMYERYLRIYYGEV
ncbi:glycosyltransferase family 4 protein [uncultured Rikenella sp.]|uniref:glycosyltransferase family 4 protein n=1 Tax=uncultured Rikenella sp. TaxID=368003 RepID=UPI0026231F69|nr:glycosyltransferase family 4 protein [uncultured Rikenella sp.]